MSDVLSSEAEAFIRAANVAGLKLPGAIVEQLERLEELKTRKGSIPQPSRVPPKSELLANGVSLDKVTAESARLEAEARELRELHDAAWKAQALVMRQVSILVAQEREGLMLALRPIVTALVEQARPLAEELEPFAPKYSTGDIIRRATAGQIEAWRKAEEAEARFGAVLSAWRNAFNATARLGGHSSPAQVAGFDPRWVDQAHYFWACPERVAEPRLNGTWYAPNASRPSAIRPTLLGVACERPDAGFRLALVRELSELYRTGERDVQTPSGGWRFKTMPMAS